MSQTGANAELIAEIIRQSGMNIATTIEHNKEMKLARAKMASEAVERVKQFTSLPQEQRQRLLDNPKFAAQLVRDMDPETFLDRHKVKQVTLDDMQNRINAVRMLGLPTEEEKAARAKALDEAAIAKENLRKLASTNKIAVDGTIPQGTPRQVAAQLQLSGMDPKMAEEIASLNEDQFRTAVQRNAKAGPAYQQDVKTDLIKWGMGPEMGLPPNVAEQMADAISKGDWKAVPGSYVDQANGKVIPIVPMAMQHLRVDQQNADTARNTMLNNEKSSVTTSTMELLKNGGAADLTFDQARADIIAMRNGTKVPYASPSLAQHSKNDLIIQQQTIDKNAQAILDDKYGISKISESLNSLVELYKQTGTVSGVLTSAQRADLSDKINKMKEALAAANSGRYGIKFDDYWSLHGGLQKAIGSVWDGMKTGGAFSSDFIKTMDEAIHTREATNINLEAQTGGYYEPPTPTTHTPEQKSLLLNLMQSLDAYGKDPNVSPETKDQLRKFMEEKIAPALEDASQIGDLFKPFTPSSSHEPDIPSTLPVGLPPINTDQTPGMR